MSIRRWAIAVLFLGTAGCGSNSSGQAEDAAVRDAAASADARVDATPTNLVRFIVMGDTGEGNDAQRAVAAAIKNKCDADGCDFAILLGDNIYNSGVESTEDQQWQDKFESPYQELDLPFYAVLGNHDYGGDLGVLGEYGGLGNEFDKGPIEVAYTQVSSKWIMPATHYTFTWGHVGFIMLDTNSILWDDTTHGNQRDWYPTALAEVAGAQWVFAAGHHPYLSNGAHGNAGSYESIEIAGVDLPITTWVGLDQLNGANVKSFMEDVVCGTVDGVFAGHDHNRQWLDERLCGAELFVSGAGAKVKDFSNAKRNPSLWQDDQTEGFLYVRIEGNRFHGQWYDKLGNLNFEHELVKN